MILEGNLITRIILNQVFNFDQQFHGLEFYHFLPKSLYLLLIRIYLKHIWMSIFLINDMVFKLF